jgi:hypothetical protein
LPGRSPVKQLVKVTLGEECHRRDGGHLAGAAAARSAGPEWLERRHGGVYHILLDLQTRYRVDTPVSEADGERRGRVRTPRNGAVRARGDSA